MPRIPDTRASLLVRLPSVQDAAAWREFIAIYEPFVYRFARRQGFQDADARELVQNVLLAVVKAVGRWQLDPQRARFRTWLFTIARNQFLNQLAKQKPRTQIHSGSSSVHDLLEQHPAPDDLADQLAIEHRRELFCLAAARVKRTVSETTWKAFWMTSVEQNPVEQAARELQLTAGAIYIAKSRVLARLRDEVRQLESDHAL
jgi:RNA polymerase sigma-70 factor (ECF subfamily)